VVEPVPGASGAAGVAAAADSSASR
jgi:hypothetical protein